MRTTCLGMSVHLPCCSRIGMANCGHMRMKSSHVIMPKNMGGIVNHQWRDTGWSLRFQNRSGIQTKEKVAPNMMGKMMTKRMNRWMNQIIKRMNQQMSWINRWMSRMNISNNHQRMVQIIFLMFSFIANPQVEEHILSGMPVKSQNCVCLSNYECHCYKRSWDIYFNSPSITVNIGQS
jgi:hypothetical protein